MNAEVDFADTNTCCRLDYHHKQDERTKAVISAGWDVRKH